MKVTAIDRGRAKLAAFTETTSEENAPTKRSSIVAILPIVSVLALVLVIFLIYSPQIAYSFACADDYWTLLEKSKNPAWIAAFDVQFCLQGRPLESLFFPEQMIWVHQIKDFVWLRLLGIVYVAFTALCFYAALLRNRWSALQSFAGAICLSTIPAFSCPSFLGNWRATFLSRRVLLFCLVASHPFSTGFAPAIDRGSCGGGFAICGRGPLPTLCHDLLAFRGHQLGQ